MPLPSWTGNRSLHGSRRASAFTPHWRPKTLGFVACEGRQRQRQQQNGCSRKQGTKVDRGSSPDSLQTSCIRTRRWRPLCGDGVPLQQTLLKINVPTNVARCMPQLPSNPIKLTTRINQKRLLIFFFLPCVSFWPHGSDTEWNISPFSLVFPGQTQTYNAWFPVFKLCNCTKSVPEVSHATGSFWSSHRSVPCPFGYGNYSMCCYRMGFGRSETGVRVKGVRDMFGRKACS